MIFNPKRKYLQIAFNVSVAKAVSGMARLPLSDQLIVEIGTPLIKERGMEAVKLISTTWRERVGSNALVVADMKCMDRGTTEVEMAVTAGANAVTCLGLAPLETIDAFIADCKKHQIASMVDMLNVPFPFEILQNLKLKPDVVVLHRGVDESEVSDNLPFYEVTRIKGAYSNVLVSLAGGESPQDLRRAYFNGVDIAVVWRDFNSNSQPDNLIENYLKSFKAYGK